MTSVPLPPADQPKKAPDIWLLVFSLLAILGLLAWAVIQVIKALPIDSSRLAQANPHLISALGMLLCAGLIAPTTFLTIRRLRGRPASPAQVRPVKLWQVILLSLVWFADIAAVYLFDRLGPIGELVSAPLALLGILIPILGLLWIALGSLAVGSWRRLWTAFGFGMTVSTLGAYLLEFLSLAVAAWLAGLLLASHPAWHAAYVQLKDQVINSSDSQATMEALAPYLTNPLIFLALLFFISAIGPVIEESLKSSMLWFMRKKLVSPAEGFALGALGGAGFALLEGLSAASGGAAAASFGVAGRATSSLMHILTSGLTGWAVASALLEKRYGRLILTYLLSIGLHGLWNGFLALTIFGGLLLSPEGNLQMNAALVFLLMGVLLLLGSLFLAILIILPILNHRLRSTPAHESVIISPAQIQ